MNATPPPEDLNEEIMTRWIDGQLSPAESEAVQRALSAQPRLAMELESAHRVGNLLRQHLPSTLEPSSPEFFTDRIMQEIQSAPVPVVPEPAAKPAGGFISWLRQPWFAPLASAAAVALLFLAANGSRPETAASGVAAKVYAPDPNVVASSFYSEEAGATVIDLRGLEAVPDDREIKAYDVADAGAPIPGKPRVFHAANSEGKAIMVLSADINGHPRIRELN